MNEIMKKILEQTNEIHMPILIDEKETAEYRLQQKPVLKSKLICDMESLLNIKAITEFAKIELTKERCVFGEHSLKFTCPTNRKNWDKDAWAGAAPGRIYAIPKAFIEIDNENWQDYNRLSFYVYPDCKGIKNLTLRVQLHNDGEHKVPDIHEREGGHNFSMKPNCFNHIVVEIPYVSRDKVIGVSFDYDMLGHEPDAVDHATFYIDKLELQEVKCDVYEGWKPADDVIAFSHSGYQPGALKIAIANGLNVETFKIVETKTGRVVLTKAIKTLGSKVGDLQILDFSEIKDEGNYIIICGDISTRVFSISSDVWENSIWKVINFFLTQRCGYEVYLKHRHCHDDMLLEHNGKSIVANGGWHDAGDLAQGFNNTAEVSQAFFALANVLKNKNQRLYRRVIEEAKWGLDYVIKTRFGDGYRASYSSCSIWTDGVIGTDDDVKSVPERSAYANFNAAYTLAQGAIAFANIDEDYSQYAMKIAKEDFAFGQEILNEIIVAKKENTRKDAKVAEVMFCRGDMIDVQVNSIASLAATEIFNFTKIYKFKTLAIDYAKIVAKCQQTEFADFDKNLVGFYFEDVDHTLIWHHNHMSYAYLPDLMFSTLCENFPNEKEYMQWYHSLYLSGKYYKEIEKYTQPYGVIPSGIYHEDEAKNHLDLVLTNHPMFEDGAKEEIIQNYEKTVKTGFPLSNGYYLRVYPVWFSFRGNYNVILADGLAVSCCAKTLNDIELYNISQNQFEWIVGKNPMARSTMFGEGYDYCQLYAVQPGQAVGAISVGMESNGINDEPFWPQVNNATYKEVWVCSANKWIWGMSNNLMPAKVSGVLKVQKNEPIIFENGQKQYFSVVNQKSGYFEIDLPAGEYTAKYGQDEKHITVISGNDYEINGELFDIETEVIRVNNQLKIKIKLNGAHSLPVKFDAYNLCDITLIDNLIPHETAIITATIINEKTPFVAKLTAENETKIICQK